MEVKIVGNRIRLKDLEIGKIAVDENSVAYTKVYVTDPKEVRTMFLKLNDLSNQYNDMIRGDTTVRELTPGESVVLTI
jgi:hypothetical protein